MDWIADVLALAALGVSLASLRKSREANEIARQSLDHSISSTSARDTPVLTFEVKTSLDEPRSSLYFVEVLINNGGQNATEIITGQIALRCHQNPEVNESKKLDGEKVIFGTPSRRPLQFKRSAIDVSRSGIPPTELICEATYTRLGKANGEETKRYILDQHQRKFVPAD